MLATRHLELEVLILLLLTVLRVVVPIMALHGKSRVYMSLSLELLLFWPTAT